MKLGILGMTGAGKSTFLNGVLGRRILALNSDICTGTIIELLEADSSASEGIEVHWFEPGRYQQMLEKESSELSALKNRIRLKVRSDERYEQLQKEESVRTERLNNLKRVRAYVRREITRGTLAQLDQYVSVAGGNRIPELVERVSVKLAHPLLQHVTLVDTPGLRDPDEQRRRIALEALAILDGWVYLVESPKAVNSAMIDDLKEIREQAHNERGLILLSKADSLTDPTGSRSITELLLERRDSYKPYTKYFIPFNAAMGVEQAGQLSPALSPKQGQQVLLGLLRESYGFPFLRKRVPPPEQSGNSLFFRDPLQAAFERLLQHSFKTNSYGLLRDILLESSNLIPTLRHAAELLNKTVIRDRVRMGWSGLQEELQRRIHWLEGRQTDTKEQLSVSQNLQQTKQLCEEKIEGLKQLQATQKAQETTHIELLNALTRSKATLTTEATQERNKQIQANKGVITKRLKEAYSGSFLRGERSINIFDLFDAPFSSKVTSMIRSGIDKWLQQVAQCDQLLEEKCKHISNSTLSGYSLHSSSSHSIQDTEQFWEWWDTTIERMLKRASASSEGRARKIINNAKELIQQIVNQAKSEIFDKIEGESSRQIIAQEKVIEELRAARDDLANDISAPQSVLRERLNKVEQDLYLLQEFATTMETWMQS